MLTPGFIRKKCSILRNNPALYVLSRHIKKTHHPRSLSWYQMDYSEAVLNSGIPLLTLASNPCLFCVLFHLKVPAIFCNPNNICSDT